MRLEANWQSLKDLKPIGLDDLQSQSDEIWNQFKEWRREREPRRSQRLYATVFKEVVGRLGRAPDQIDRTELLREVPLDLASKDGEIFNNTFSRICLRYHVRSIQKRADGLSSSEFRDKYGPPPWEVLNEILAAAKMQFTVTDPTNLDIIDKFECRMRDSATGATVSFTELSSGEQVIVSTVFWLFNSRNKAVFPKLLLLDEPDAHLHPALTKQFLNVVTEAIVGNLGVRIIMTSHSPSTVAMAPEESLWEMRRDGPRKVCREEAISALSDGLVVVRPGIRWVLVEDRDDRAILKELFSDLASSGLVDSSIPLAFVSAGADTREQPSGGRRNVLKWVGKLRECGLSEFHGLVDMDDEAPSAVGVVALNRYSIENYLCDPLVAYWALVDQGQAPPIDGVNVVFGKEHEMQSVPQNEIDTIVDFILGKVEAQLDRLTEDDVLESKVSYVNDVSCKVRNWQIRRRGRDVLQAFQQAFGMSVTPLTLRKSLRRTGLIASDLKEAFCKLQGL